MPRPRPESTTHIDVMPDRLFLSPERAQLADALAAVASIEGEIAKVPADIEAAELDRHNAWLAVREAERALAHTQRLAASTFTPLPRPPSSFWSQEAADTYVAEQSTPPIPIADARQAVATAKETEQSAEAALNFLRSKQGRLAERLRLARYRVAPAVRAVVKSDPALAALAAEAKRLATRAASAALAFADATGGADMPSNSPFYECTKPAHHSVDPQGWAISRAWFDALQRLETDAATPFPMIKPVP